MLRISLPLSNNPCVSTTLTTSFLQQLEPYYNYYPKALIGMDQICHSIVTVHPSIFLANFIVDLIYFLCKLYKPIKINHL